MASLSPLISVSSLDAVRPIHQSSVPMNTTALAEFNRKQNLYASVRDYLIASTVNLTIATPNSIRLQASALSQLTQVHNSVDTIILRKLHISTSHSHTIVCRQMMAASKSLQLAKALGSMSARIPFEDVKRAAKEIATCLSNVLTVRFPPRSLRNARCLPRR